MTATSTDPNATDTSMFSTCAVVQGNSPGTGTLSGSLALNGGQNIDLTALGTQDWAVWGFANSGMSTSLTPDLRKANGFGISDLTDIPVSGAPLRGLGQFPDQEPFTFSWTNAGGAPTTTSSGTAGIQHNGGVGPCPCGTGVSTLGAGFSFHVPADTTPRTLTIFTTAHWATGTLVASLSDGSAPAYTNTVTSPSQGPNDPGIFTITYAAGQAAQLNVSWIETADNCPSFHCDNAALSAVALSPASTMTGATATLTSGSAVASSGSNDPISTIPLSAFAPTQTGVTPAPINGLPLNGLPLNGLPLNGLPLNGLPLNGLPLNGLPLNGLPLNGLPLNGLPLNGLPLNGLPLNGLPLNGLQIPGGWTAVLAGTALAGKPLQTITLQQVLALNPQPAAVHNLTLGNLLVADSALGQETIGALALGNTPINGLGTPAQTQAIATQLLAWCRSIPAAAANCSLDTIGNQSLFALSLAGAPINGLPINGLPMNGLPLNGLPLNGLPINGLPINGLNLSASPLNGLPINGLQLLTGFASVVNCSKIDCSATSTRRSAMRRPPERSHRVPRFSTS